MYLLYPATAGGYAIFEIPSDQTAEELATSFGLTMAQCAEFDMADFDAGAVNFPYNFTLVDNQPLPNGAAFDLPGAKEQASILTKANSSSLQQTALNGFAPEALAAQATLPEIDRLPEIQVVLDAVNVLAVDLSGNLAAIAAATDINEVNNVVNPPTGTLEISRTGVTLNESVYLSFNSTSLTEADTELYIPGSTTTIAYVGGAFPQTPAAFSPGDFLIQIRVSSSGQVLKEFECPDTSTEIAF